MTGWALVLLASSWSVVSVLYPGLFLLGLSTGLSTPLTSVYVTETAATGNKGVVTSIFNCQVTSHTKCSHILSSPRGAWAFDELRR